MLLESISPPTTPSYNLPHSIWTALALNSNWPALVAVFYESPTSWWLPPLYTFFSWSPQIPSLESESPTSLFYRTISLGTFIHQSGITHSIVRDSLVPGVQPGLGGQNLALQYKQKINSQ